ncbi:hypothetical protein ACFL27_28785 [candidate division CSSED10-310 bacterium]|uniref:Uridine phosphorylase n=1 Tax=candidate division CSSED10-310 bacterium TaxID=2855610 RepID=A0ABV6Z6Y1_UNCC1
MFTQYSDRQRIAKMILGTKTVDPIIILPATDSMRKRIERKFQKKKTTGSVTRVSICDQSVSICSTGIGAPSTEIIVNGLIAGGAKQILRFDVCGGLVDDLNVGDMFIARRAYAFDGVSQLYVDSPEIEACAALWRRFTDFLTRSKFSRQTVRSGTIATVDFFFAQTLEHHLTWRNVAEAVDMETAAIYALCQAAGVEALSVMIVSDVKSKKQDPFLNGGFDFMGMRKGLNNLIDLISPFIETISENKPPETVPES